MVRVVPGYLPEVENAPRACRETSTPDEIRCVKFTRRDALTETLQLIQVPLYMLGIGRFIKNRVRPNLLRWRHRHDLVYDTIYRFKELNTKLLKPKMESFSDAGIDPDAENNIIVSLTSYPERIQETPYTVYSLLTQTLRPQKVILWLAAEQFPSRESGLPSALLKLRDNGLEIRWTHDILSYKKLVPALRTLPKKTIVTADDDIFFPREWLARLYDDYAATGDGKCVYAHRIYTLPLSDDGRPGPWRTWTFGGTPAPSFLHTLNSGAGTLFPPGSLHPDVLNEELFMRLAPQADDLFFWAMAVLNGCKIQQVSSPITRLIMVNAPREAGEIEGSTLLKHNVCKGGNDRQLANILAYYPKILGTLQAC